MDHLSNVDSVEDEVGVIDIMVIESGFRWRMHSLKDAGIS